MNDNPLKLCFQSIVNAEKDIELALNDFHNSNVPHYLRRALNQLHGARCLIEQSEDQAMEKAGVRIDIVETEIQKMKVAFELLFNHYKIRPFAPEMRPIAEELRNSFEFLSFGKIEQLEQRYNESFYKWQSGEPEND